MIYKLIALRSSARQVILCHEMRVTCTKTARPVAFLISSCYVSFHDKYNIKRCFFFEGLNFSNSTNLRKIKKKINSLRTCIFTFVKKNHISIKIEAVKHLHAVFSANNRTVSMTS